MLSEPFAIHNKPSIVKLDVQVIFGTLSAKCTFSGICQILILPEQKNESLSCCCEHKANAQLLFHAEERKIGLAFDFSFINTKEWKAFFSNFYFQVDKDWSSTPIINSRLNVSPFLIEKGIYDVFICEEGIRIWFCEKK